MNQSNQRRRVLRAAAIGGAGILAGAGAVGGAAAATGGPSDRNERFAVEVACRGETTRSVDPPDLRGVIDRFTGLELDDLRGGVWWVEGYIYPDGTIKGDGFIPTADGSIGTWFCRGHQLNSSARPEPHLVTSQEYYLGSLDEEVIGANLLTSKGIEGRNDDGWQALRVVEGGTGDYRGARGQVLQTHIGFNSSQFPWGFNALNFRFEFDIDVP